MRRRIHPVAGLALAVLVGCGGDERGPGGGDDDAATDVPRVEPVGHVTDIDGNEYGYVEIGGYHITQPNLDVVRYRNGDPIPEVQDPAEWSALTTGAWCHYENSTANGTTYGRLYNWHAVNDPRGLAPEGWHVPTPGEWEDIADAVGGSATAGGALKATSQWQSSGGGSDAFGFIGLPGGSRDPDGAFDDLRGTGRFWTDEEYTAGSDPEAKFVTLVYYNDGFGDGHNRQTYGFSVRVIED